LRPTPAEGIPLQLGIDAWGQKKLELWGYRSV